MSTPLKSKIAVPRSNDREVAGVKYNRSTSGRSKFEMLAWLYMRISGVVLLVLVFGHLFVNLMVGDGINRIDFAFVAGKLADPFWQWYDALLLWLALIHGTNGMRTIVNDYVSNPRVRRILHVALIASTAVLLAPATIVTRISATLAAVDTLRDTPTQVDEAVLDGPPEQREPQRREVLGEDADDVDPHVSPRRGRRGVRRAGPGRGGRRPRRPRGRWR